MMYVIIASEDRDTDRYPSPLIEKGRDASSCARLRVVVVEQMDLFCLAVRMTCVRFSLCLSTFHMWRVSSHGSICGEIRPAADQICLWHRPDSL